MFARLSVATIALAMAVPMALASPFELNARADSCNTGSVQCCQNIESSSNPAVSSLAGLLGVALGLTKTVGLSCTPLNVLAAGGNHCTQQTACCTGNTFNGLITLGCTPISASV